MLTREVLQPPACAHTLAKRIAIGAAMLIAGGCILGEIAQRLEASDRAAEARIETICGPWRDGARGCLETNHGR